MLGNIVKESEIDDFLTTTLVTEEQEIRTLKEANIKLLRNNLEKSSKKIAKDLYIRNTLSFSFSKELHCEYFYNNLSVLEQEFIITTLDYELSINNKETEILVKRSFKIFFDSPIEHVVKKFEKDLQEVINIYGVKLYKIDSSEINQSMDLILARGIGGLVHEAVGHCLEAAEIIREESNDIIIIFLTSMDNMVYDSFRYQPLDFIRKIRFDIKIGETIGMIIDKLDRKEETVLYPIGTENGIVKLNLRELLYVECVQRKPHFHMKENKYISTDKKFSEVIEYLDKRGFIQSHRLCIVNLDYIYKIKDIEIELTNGFKVPMSRKNRKVVRDAFLNYII
mgnify:CR=1 FL=1